MDACSYTLGYGQTSVTDHPLTLGDVFILMACYGIAQSFLDGYREAGDRKLERERYERQQADEVTRKWTKEYGAKTP